MTGSTRRQQHRERRDDLARVGHLVEDQDSSTDPVQDDQVYREVTIAPVDALAPTCLGHEDPDHFVARGITTRSQDPTSAVSSFPRKGEPPADLVELGPPGDQLLDSSRALFNQHTDGLRA